MVDKHSVFYKKWSIFIKILIQKKKNNKKIRFIQKKSVTSVVARFVKYSTFLIKIAIWLVLLYL